MKELIDLIQNLPAHAKTNDKLDALKLLVSNLEHIPTKEVENLAKKYQKNFRYVV